MSDKQSVFITGASSGIGENLARSFAKRGCVVGLAARRTERLKALAAELSHFTQAHVFELDVSNTQACVSVAKEFMEINGGRIDYVFANAGIGNWKHPAEADVFEWAKMIDVNFKGAVNTLMPFVPQMTKQKSGHLIAVSSVAGLRALPGGPYSATKAALRYFMDGLRVDLKPMGIDVTTVCPGFVKTEMLAGNHNYPFLISVEKAIEEILYAVDGKLSTHIFPWQWRTSKILMQMLPDYLFSSMTKKITNQG